MQLTVRRGVKAASEAVYSPSQASKWGSVYCLHFPTYMLHHLIVISFQSGLRVVLLVKSLRTSSCFNFAAGRIECNLWFDAVGDILMAARPIWRLLIERVEVLRCVCTSRSWPWMPSIPQCVAWPKKIKKCKASRKACQMGIDIHWIQLLERLISRALLSQVWQPVSYWEDERVLSILCFHVLYQFPSALGTANP